MVKKNMTTLVVLTLVIAALVGVSTNVVATLQGAEDYPIGDCAWDECNPAFVYDDVTPGQNPANIVTIATVGGNSGGSGGDPGSGGTSTDAPIIKCKWEYDYDVLVMLDECPECEVPEGCDYVTGTWQNDACPCIPGLQVKPVLGKSVKVQYFAVVTDPQGVSSVDRVYADVWHPDGQFKYQIELSPVGLCDETYNNAEALQIWNKAKTCHEDLIKINTDWASTLDPAITNAWDDIYDELAENMAYLYMGEAEISYCQPGGYYTVGVVAFDHTNEKSSYLFNRFWYIPVAAVDIDFETVDYGTISIGYRKQVGGDDDLTTPTKPTVRNIGNTPVNLFVMQDDMTFGETGGVPNVHYDARMGIEGDYVPYDPDVEVQIPGCLALCTKDKLDFGITAEKGENGLTYTGEMCLRACIVGCPSDWTAPCEQVGSAPNGVLQNFVWP